jgi:hypothetical protein
MNQREAVAAARAKAFPRPIVILRMSRAQFDAAYLASTETERRDLDKGLESGQIELSQALPNQSPEETR